MNSILARELLLSELATWRTKSYAELADCIGTVHVAEIVGADGKRYQVEVQVFWDSPKSHTNIRVLGQIDDGGWRAFFPLIESFIVAPDGSFIGET